MIKIIQKLEENLKDKFKNTFKFNGINNFILLLRKSFYPYEFEDDWEKFNENLQPEKEGFYNNLIIVNIMETDADLAKRICKDIKIKNMGKYHDLYLKNDTLLADVFEKFTKFCLEIYELDSAKCLSATGLVFQAALKKTKVKLKLLTHIDMLLMAEEGISGGLCNNKYMKDYDKN